MIVEALLANIAILLGLALVLWVIAVQIDDVSFVDAYWGGGMAIMAVVSLTFTTAVVVVGHLINKREQERREAEAKREEASDGSV